MSQFDHESVKGTDLSGGEEEEELQDTELDAEDAVKVGDKVADVVDTDAPSAPESSTEQE